jgi:hypothetical protein
MRLPATLSHPAGIRMTCVNYLNASLSGLEPLPFDGYTLNLNSTTSPSFIT